MNNSFGQEKYQPSKADSITISNVLKIIKHQDSIDLNFLKIDPANLLTVYKEASKDYTIDMDSTSMQTVINDYLFDDFTDATNQINKNWKGKNKSIIKYTCFFSDKHTKMKFPNFGIMIKVKVGSRSFYLILQELVLIKNQMFLLKDNVFLYDTFPTFLLPLQK